MKTFILIGLLFSLGGCAAMSEHFRCPGWSSDPTCQDELAARRGAFVAMGGFQSIQPQPTVVAPTVSSTPRSSQPTYSPNAVVPMSQGQNCYQVPDANIPGVYHLVCSH